MKISVATGENRLETLALDDRLKSLGVVVDPTTRSVDELGAKRSSVKGGIHGLAQAAALTGAKDTLDAAESAHIPVTFVGGLRSLRTDAKAQSKMNDAITSLRSGTSAILDFMDGPKFSVSQVASLFRRMTAVSNKVAQATSPGTIGHTTPEQRSELRHELAAYAKTVGAQWSAFARLIDEQVMPFASQSSQRYNAAGDAYGYGPEAVYAAEAASGTTREAINTVLRNVGSIRSAHVALMNSAALFADAPKPRLVPLTDHRPTYRASDTIAEAKVGGHLHTIGVVIEDGASKAWIARDGENIGLVPLTWEPGLAALPATVPGMSAEARDALNAQLQSAVASGIALPAR